MSMIRAYLPLAACTVMFACAPPPAAKSPPVAAVPVDGTYRGTSTRYLAESRTCPHPGLVTLHVQNAQFSYRWDRAIWVDSSIDSNGSVHGATESVTLQGQRDGGKIEGDLTNGLCSLHFTVNRWES